MNTNPSRNLKSGVVALFLILSSASNADSARCSLFFGEFGFNNSQKVQVDPIPEESLAKSRFKRELWRKLDFLKSLNNFHGDSDAIKILLEWEANGRDIRATTSFFLKILVEARARIILDYRPGEKISSEIEASLQKALDILSNIQLSDIDYTRVNSIHILVAQVLRADGHSPKANRATPIGTNVQPVEYFIRTVIALEYFADVYDKVFGQAESVVLPSGQLKVSKREFLLDLVNNTGTIRNSPELVSLMLDSMNLENVRNLGWLRELGFTHELSRKPDELNSTSLLHRDSALLGKEAVLVKVQVPLQLLDASRPPQPLNLTKEDLKQLLYTLRNGGKLTIRVN